MSSPYDNTTVISAEINSVIGRFHEHTGHCAVCTYPLQTYQSRGQLCSTGLKYRSKLIKLLYEKAEYKKSGTFIQEVPRGWEAVSELIQTITHQYQGEYTLKIVDLKRAQPANANASSRTPRFVPGPALAVPTPTPALPIRGSGYAEDQERLYKTSKRSSGELTYITPPSSGPSTPEMRYLDAHMGHHRSGSDSGSGSKLSGRSVKFDKHIHVREFTP